MAINYDAGVYLVQPVEHPFTESKNGKPMINITVRPIERVFNAGMDGEYKEPVQCEKFGYFNLVMDPDNEQSQGITMRKLRTIGWIGQDFNAFVLTEPFLCEMRHGEYQGKAKEEWDVYLPSRSKEHQPALGNRMNEIMAKVLASESLNPAAVPVIDVSQPAGTAPTLVTADADIPF